MIETRLDPRQAMAAGLAQWRESIVGCDDAGLRDQLRDIEAVSRMVHAVMLAAVAELDARGVAATSGFGTTKQLLAGMLHLSATEAGSRVTHAAQLTPRCALGGEAGATVAEHRRGAGRWGDRAGAGPGETSKR